MSWPCSGRATPARRPVSSKVPSPRFRKSEARQLVVRDVEVDEPVAVVVGEREPHAPPRVRRESRLRGHILERPVAPVPVERQRDGREPLGVAVDADAAGLVAAEAVVALVPHRVVHDQEVEPAVVVVVEPAGADHPLVAREARLRGHVLEPPADVAVQVLAVDSANEEVGTTVVVVVGHGGGRAVALAPQPGLLRPVGEPHPALVPVEAIPVARGVLHQARERWPRSGRRGRSARRRRSRTPRPRRAWSRSSACAAWASSGRRSRSPPRGPRPRRGSAAWPRERHSGPSSPGRRPARPGECLRGEGVAPGRASGGAPV